MGTAFDYLLRFHLQRAHYFAVSKRWIAEHAHKLASSEGTGIFVQTSSDILLTSEVAARMGQILTRAKRLHSSFIAGEPQSNSLLRSVINLAHCDPFYRALRLSDEFGKPQQSQVRELAGLIEATDLSQFRAKHVCLLNPDFGQGSQIVGGADADLLIDDMLIDIKTTSTLEIRTEDFRQLVCYAALNEHFPIGGGDQPMPIRRAGYYFSRYAYLVSWPMYELVDQDKFIAFAAWLRDHATEAYTARERRRAEFQQRMTELRAQEEARRQREAEAKRKRRASLRRERMEAKRPARKPAKKKTTARATRPRKRPKMRSR